MRISGKKVAYIGLMLAIALIISVVESFIPPVIPMLPMIKIGLSNVIIMLTYIMFGGRVAFTVLLTRCLLVSVFSLNFFSLAFSIPSGIISLSITIMLISINKNSLVAISAFSAIIHNATQIFIASIITNTSAVFMYLPYLFVIGGACGILTGLVATLVIKKMPSKMFLSLND